MLNNLTINKLDSLLGKAELSVEASREELRTAAIGYCKKNISVIPVAKDKKPLVKWQEFQTRRANEQEINKWFKQFPDMQIAIVCGKISGLIVVDIDKPDMDLSWLPETSIIKTGSGGFHYYYKYCPGVNNKVRIKDYIDLRGDGGFVICPPSVNLKGKYEIINRKNLASFPINLFSQNIDLLAYRQSYQGDYIGYGQGERNDQMTRWIGHLLAKIHPSEWESIAWNAVVDANAKNIPPLGEGELRSIFNSISGKERNNTTERWYKKAEDEKINLIVKNDYKSRYTWGTNELDSHFAIIKRGNFIIIGARRNSGKTVFSFDMAFKNALLGHNVLYLSLEMDEEKILSDFARKYAGISIEEEYNYLIPDYKQQAFQRKIAEIKSVGNLYFRGMRRGNGTTWNIIVKKINEFSDLDLIFIDNLDLIDGEVKENDFDRQKRISKLIMNFTEEKKIPVVLIHHHRKIQAKDFGADELAGSGKIADNADIILKIQRNDDPNSVYPEKYKSKLFQQKGRGYGEASCSIYFVRGTFCDTYPSVPPNWDEPTEEEIKKAQEKMSWADK
jgi:archaellum biogenesis ATPase FlaH